MKDILPDAPPVPIFISIIKFTESMMMMDGKQRGLIIGRDTDTYDNSQWDFKTVKLILPYLNTPSKIAKKCGMALFDPNTGQKGWISLDAIMNNTFVYDTDCSNPPKNHQKIINEIDSEMLEKNWECVFLNKSELHNHIEILTGIIFKKMTPLYDPISLLFGNGTECHLCGCPYDTGECHGCGELDPLLESIPSMDDIIDAKYNLGKEWE